MEINKIQHAIEILVNDFDDVTEQEFKLLRSVRKSYYQMPCDNLGVYLTLKLKLIPELESVRITPNPEKRNFEPFGSQHLVIPQHTVPTFNPLHEAFKGVFYVSGDITLPLLTASFKTDKIILTCLSPDGNFCYISSDKFKFEI